MSLPNIGQGFILKLYLQLLLSILSKRERPVQLGHAQVWIIQLEASLPHIPPVGHDTPGQDYHIRKQENAAPLHHLILVLDWSAPNHNSAAARVVAQETILSQNIGNKAKSFTVQFCIFFVGMNILKVRDSMIKINSGEPHCTVINSNLLINSGSLKDTGNVGNLPDR